LKIILSAPATEMSEYNGNPAIAFVAGFSKPFFIPRSYLKNVLYKPVPSNEDGEVIYAPLGIRLIEASLINSGMYKKEDVIIVHPDNLEEKVSESTRIIGISTKDPLGLGYVSLTYSTLTGLGNSINKYEFLQLMKKIVELKNKYRFKVVVGGPGIWQFKLYDDISNKLGIDVIVSGEGEAIVPKIFTQLINGEHVDGFIEGMMTPPKLIPCILGATIYGAIEVTRGCGRGCLFCTPTMRIKRDIPLEKILRDVEVNLKNGQDKLLLVTEDLFLYGSNYPWEPNEDALIKLVDSITKYRYHGLKYVQVTHMNLAAVRYKKSLFKIIADKLHEFAWFKLRNNYICTVEVGIESGSPKIIGKLMRGKALPYTHEEWPETVLESLILMEEHDWIPLATLIVGLPEENEDDTIKTLELISKIRQHGLRTFLVPLLFVPLGGCALENQPIKSFEELNMTQLSIFSECWKHNVRIWGEDHFKNYNNVQKLLFKITSKMYLATIAKKYRWREQIALDIYSELKKLSDGDTKEYE